MFSSTTDNLMDVRLFLNKTKNIIRKVIKSRNYNHFEFIKYFGFQEYGGDHIGDAIKTHSLNFDS